MKLGSWNEKDNPDLPAWQVLYDARKVKWRFRGASIIGGQEFGEVADHRAIDTAFGRPWSHVLRTQATPLIWNRYHFRLLDFGWVRTHNGIAHVTPHRGFTWGLFRRRRRFSLKPFYVYNTHCISKPTSNEARWALWSEHIDELVAHIAKRHATGRDIFVVGDFNRFAAPHLHPSQRVLVSHWLDHVIFIPGGNGNQVTIGDRIVMDGLYTDHDPIGVRVSLSPKA